jgi:hypothetical protein
MKKSLIVIMSLVSFGCAAQEKISPQNLISVSPAALSQTTATGVDVTYERFLGNSGKWSMTIPVAYSFGHSDPCDPNIKTDMLRTFPGIKYYPGGNNHIVSYSIGASVELGKGKSNCNCNVENTQSPETGIPGADNNNYGFRPMTEMGVLIFNGIKAQATPRIFIGGEFGIGGVYVGYNNRNYTDLAFELNFRIGYRF